jgi:hypothetical protein
MRAKSSRETSGTGTSADEVEEERGGGTTTSEIPVALSLLVLISLILAFSNDAVLVPVGGSVV